MERVIQLLDWFKDLRPTVNTDEEGEPESITVTIPLSKPAQKL